MTYIGTDLVKLVQHKTDRSPQRDVLLEIATQIEALKGKVFAAPTEAVIVDSEPSKEATRRKQWKGIVSGPVR